MRLLCLDTSSPTGGLGVGEIHGQQFDLKAKVEWSRGQSHSELVTTSLESCLAQTKWPMQSLTGLAVGIGPGSFTGVRVGINVAKTLGYALGLTIYSLNSLRVLAQPGLVADGLPVLCLVNAFKNMVYVAQYHRLGDTVVETIEPAAIRPEEVERLISSPTMVAGDGWASYSEIWSQRFKDLVSPTNLSFPRAESLGEILAKTPEALQKNLWSDLKPLYIRASEAEEKLHSGLLKPVSRV